MSEAQLVDLWGQVGGYVPLDLPSDVRAVRAGVGPSANGQLEVRGNVTLSVVDGRVRADLDGVNVGWLPQDVVAGYVPVLEAMAARGQVARVGGRVRVYDPGHEEGGEEHEGYGPYISSYLFLAEPHLIEPMNQPPTAAFVEFPEGRKQKVAVTADAGDQDLCPYLRPEGAGWVYCLLRPRTEQLARTTREVVEVRVGATTMGTLTPAMSKNFLPLVNLVIASGRMPVARGLIKGNHLQTEMSVAALKSSEVTQSWLREHSLQPAASSADSLATPDLDDDPIAPVSDGTREPGFYADPEGMADERFWDGFDWTTRIRMRPRPQR